MEIGQKVCLHHSLDGFGTINTLFLREHDYKAPVEIIALGKPGEAIVELPDGYKLTIRQRDIE